MAICSCYRIRTCACGSTPPCCPLHQTDFTKYRPYLLLTLHGFLVRYFPTPPINIVQMLSDLSGRPESNRLNLLLGRQTCNHLHLARIMTFYVQYPQRSNCANLRFGLRIWLSVRDNSIFVPAAVGLKYNLAKSLLTELWEPYWYPCAYFIVQPQAIEQPPLWRGICCTVLYFPATSRWLVARHVCSLSTTMRLIYGTPLCGTHRVEESNTRRLHIRKHAQGDPTAVRDISILKKSHTWKCSS